MNRILILTCVLIIGYHFVQGQSCPQTLRLAQSTYEQGRLHELPSLLEKCLNTPDGFNKQQKVTAYQLLTLAYIYLEEPDKADEMMLKLIQTDNYFKPNEQVDPAEFVALYRTFRTDPIFRVGAKIGAVATEPNVASSQEASPGTADYSRSYGPAFGLSFEILWKKRFLLNPELFYSTQTFNYKNTNTTAAGDFNTDVVKSMNYVSMPLSVQYSLMDRVSLLNPYVSAGVAPEYLLSATTSPSRKLAGNQPVESKSYSSTKEFERFNLSLLAAAGLKYRFAGGYVIGELRFKYGLLNVNKPSSSYQVPEIAWDYHYMDGIFKLTALQVNVGYVHNIFNPKKLTVKK